MTLKTFPRAALLALAALIVGLICIEPSLAQTPAAPAAPPALARARGR